MKTIYVIVEGYDDGCLDPHEEYPIVAFEDEVAARDFVRQKEADRAPLQKKYRAWIMNKPTRYAAPAYIGLSKKEYEERCVFEQALAQWCRDNPRPEELPDGYPDNYYWNIQAVELR